VASALHLNTNKGRCIVPFTINEEKSYDHPADAVYEAAVGAVGGLQGEVKARQAGQLEARFNKTIHGQVLGDRTEMKVALATAANGSCRIAVEIYPIDAVGRKLAFGARKGVARKVLDWYWAHLEHRLPG
jgi:hypothetical protein